MKKTQTQKPSTPAWKADEAWRSSIQRDPESCLRLFFPELADEIDWSQPVELMERELLQVARKAKIKKRAPDVLMKVHLKNGRTEFILLHCEVQSQDDEYLVERLFEYSVLLYLNYRLPVLTLALLASLDHNWHIDHLDILAVRDFGIRFKFCACNIWSLSDQALANHQDLFTFYTRAHRLGLQTQGKPEKRHAVKVMLLADLYRTDLPEDEREFAASMIDNWLMQTSAETEQCYQELEQIIRDEQEDGMHPAVSLLGPLRKKYYNKGREEGREEGQREGRQEGRQETTEETAKRMLKEGLGADLIARVTGLSRDAIKALSLKI